MPRAFRNLPDFANFNWFPKSHAERMLPLRAEPEQTPLFHLGGPPGDSPEAMAERDALSRAVKVRNQRDYDPHLGDDGLGESNWDSKLSPAFIEPGEAPQLYAALNDAQLLAPETFKEVGQWTMGDLDPETRGAFRDNQRLMARVDFDPEVSPHKLKAYKVMNELPAGDVFLNEDIAKRSYDDALTTILHEMSHAQTAADNPRWSNRTYHDTAAGQNEQVNDVWRSEGINDMNRRDRYQFHPEEIKARAAGRGYSIPPPPPDKLDPLLGWSQIGGAVSRPKRWNRAYQDYIDQQEAERQAMVHERNYRLNNPPPPLDPFGDFEPLPDDYDIGDEPDFDPGDYATYWRK